MTRSLRLLAAAWTCTALAPAMAQIQYSQSTPATVLNTGMQVSPSINNGLIDVVGPGVSTGTINAPIGSGIALQRTVSSVVDYGDASAVVQGSLSMSATLTGDRIRGTGTLESDATLADGKTGGATVASDGSVQFNIYFTLSKPLDVTLNFQTTSSTSVTKPQPNNLAVIFLQNAAFSPVLFAQSLGNQDQSGTWSGLLPAGTYLLSGGDSYQDPQVSVSANGGSPDYSTREFFAFDVSVGAPARSVPEPGTLALLAAALAGLCAHRRRRT